MVKKIAVGVVLALVLAVGIYRITAKTESVMTVERTFNAPVDKVWHTWNDPELMKQWWSPKDYTAPVIKNDLRVGGKFLLSMRSPKGEMFWNTGTYKDIVPNKRIIAQMSFSDENGKVVTGKDIKVPGEWPDEITVKVEFRETGGKTRVQVTEVGIPMVMGLFARMGWNQQFDKFEKLL